MRHRLRRLSIRPSRLRARLETRLALTVVALAAAIVPGVRQRDFSSRAMHEALKGCSDELRESNRLLASVVAQLQQQQATPRSDWAGVVMLVLTVLVLAVAVLAWRFPATSGNGPPAGSSSRPCVAAPGHATR